MKIKRLIYNELARQIDEPKVSILIGPRQVGKTFLMRELEAEAASRGLETRYFDLEQPGDLLAMGATDKEQFDALISSGDIVFVDEMHLVKNISHIFKAVFDSKHNVKIFASGSSALAMHKHIKESMAGRTIVTRIYPLCLSELKQLPAYDDKDIFVFGGLPGLVHRSNVEGRIAELEQIVSTYIAKDIKGIIREENIRAFNHLIYLLAEHQGSVVTTASLSREIGLSKPAVETYLDILAQTYVCYPIFSYAKNRGNELKKSRKQYVFDVGIRNSMLRDFRRIEDRDDAGALTESYVLQNIMRQLKPNMEVRFWRTKQGDEIDFILIKNRIPFPVEVKSRLQSAVIPRGIKIFLDNYRHAPGAMVMNDSIEEDIEYSGRTIQFRKTTYLANIPYLQEVR